jgi:sortase A
MSKVGHNNPRVRRGSIAGELLILVGILFLGLALSIPVGAALDAPPSDAVAAPQPTPDAVSNAPVRSLVPAPVSLTPTSTAVPELLPPAAGDATALPTATPLADPPPLAATLATPTPVPPLPGATHIAIPSVGIDTKIVDVGYQSVTIDGQTVRQLQVAAYAAGHDAQSANPGAGGNIVISGHDDWQGEVFKNLDQVQLGDQVVLTTPDATHRYVITEIIYRKDTGASLADRLAAGQYLAPMPEERVTLVTCWPYGVDTHRLIVVAKPLERPCPESRCANLERITRLDSNDFTVVHAIFTMRPQPCHGLEIQSQ